MVCLVAAWIAIAGCSGDGRLDVTPVRGKVVYKGNGVPQATIIFFPVEPVNEGHKKLRPFAYADANGEFELKTYVAGDGAPPGKYRVSIIAASTGGSGGSKKDQPASESGATALPTVAIPPGVTKKYANVDTAGIEVTIVDGDNNLEPFVLTM